MSPHEDHYRRRRPECCKARPARTEDHFRSRCGLGGIKNGELLRLVSAQFDVFITSDKNLRHQQNLAAFELSIILLPSNQVPVVKALLSQIDDALANIGPHDFVEI